VRFGSFEFDPSTRALSKGGFRLRVPDQSLTILAMLIERPGEVVNRDEIRHRLWPNGTIVDFEYSVNSAVQRLREALRDSAGVPHFVETLPKRGYRFIAALHRDEPSPRYQILGEVGRGAMGIVYRAEDLCLKRIVALKSVPDEVAVDARALERVVRDGRAMAALNHPGICTLYGTDEHGGRPCLVMKFVEGGSLDRLRAGGQLGWKQVIDIGIRVAEALQVAHNAGIIHRDVNRAISLYRTLGRSSHR
jgi:eukaryotic-like serine/threonine-protein kinase